MAVKASAEITLVMATAIQSVTRYYKLIPSMSSAPTSADTTSWSTTEPAITSSNLDQTLYQADLTTLTDGSSFWSEISQSASWQAAISAYNKATSAGSAANAALAAASEAKTSIDGLVIGGRNLALETADKPTWTWNNQSSVQSSPAPNVTIYLHVHTGQSSHYQFSLYAKSVLKEGVKAILSFDYTHITGGSGTPSIKYYVARKAGALDYGIISSNPTGHMSLPITINASQATAGTLADGIWFDYTITNANSSSSNPYLNNQLVISNLKFELGTKATDWTPAPEDVDEQVDIAKRSASAALGSAADAMGQAFAAMAAAEKALSATEVIVGTQTAATAAWEGDASFSKLKDGQQIVYWLPVASAANATLNLRLPDGTSTSPKNVYIGGTTRCGTHIAAGNLVQMVYRENVTIGSAAYTGWWISRSQDTTTNYYDRICYKASVTAVEPIAAGRLGVFDSSGKLILLSTDPFDVTKPILYIGTAYAAGKLTQTNNYIAWGTAFSLASTVSGFSGTAGATVYIKGTLNGSLFTPAAGVLTTTVPASADGYTYILLGLMSTATNAVLAPEHPMFRFYNGAFKSISQLSYEAFVAAEEAQEQVEQLEIGGRNLVLATADGKTTDASVSQSVYTGYYYFSDYGRELLFGNTTDLITVSFLYEVTGATAYSSTVPDLYAQINSSLSAAKPLKITQPDQSGRCVSTFKLAASQANLSGQFYVRIRMRQTVDGATLHVWNLKIEKGSKPTDWTPAPEDGEAAIEAVQGYAEEVKAQLDGKIETWVYAGIPGAAVPPESTWAAADKALHIGDLYYDTLTGQSYRYTSSQTWEAYDNATLAAALELADKKKRVFTSTPTPPYDKGDLWAGGAAADMKVCVTAKAASDSFSENDWGLAAAAVADLSIGGRNLIHRTLSPSATMAVGTRPTINGVSEAVFSSSTSFYPDLHGLRIVANTAVRPYIRFGSNSSANNDMLGLIPGETYTLSCDAEMKLLSGTQTSSTYNTYAYLYHATSSGGSYTAGTIAANTAYMLCSYPQAQKGTVQTKRVEWTFTVPANAVACYLFFANTRTTARHSAAGDYIILSNLKLEKGAKATDWTPAPEDVASALHENETALETYRNAVTTRFETAEGLISGKVSQTSYDEQMQIVDGRMTRIEGRAESVEAEVRTLYGEDSSLLRLDTQGLHMQQNQVDKYELLMQADKLSYLRRDTGDAVAVFGAEGVYADRLRSLKTLSVGSDTEGWYDFSILRTGMAEK